MALYATKDREMTCISETLDVGKVWSNEKLGRDKARVDDDKYLPFKVDGGYEIRSRAHALCSLVVREIRGFSLI